MFGQFGKLKHGFRKLASLVAQGASAATYAGLICSSINYAEAGNYVINWNTLAYPASTLAPAAPNFVITDQYGFQVRMALVHPTTNYTALTNPAEDTANLGGIIDIIIANDAPQNLGGFGEDIKTATFNIYQVGTTTNVPVNNLVLRVTDIDPLDNNTPISDRCDMVTITGNSGNPTLSYVNGAPTGDGSNASFFIGPSTGPGTSGTNANSRTVFTKTGGGTARTNLNLTANQAHCLYYTNAGSIGSTNDAAGSLDATFPNGTSQVTIRFDEVIENALGALTPANQNAPGRGIGVWGGGSFSINSTITLDKQTTATNFTSAGEVISYSFVITNVGPVPINVNQNIQINDSKIGLINCPAIPVAGIAAGGTHTCTANYTVTAADVTAGLVSNTATAGVGTGTQTFATRLQSNPDTVVVPRRTTLTLVKTLTNDNGGTATLSAFTLSAAGPTSISGISGAASVTNAVVSAGTYTLSETNVSGYAASAWNCTAGTLTGSSLVLISGQSATCTINNNDIAPRLTLVKTVTNDNGGTATTADFTLSASGPTSISGLSAAPAVTNVAVNAGTYTLAETPLVGYTASLWSCPGVTVTSSSITLSIGQNITCTINNNDIAPRLTLVKTVTNDNGGTAMAAAFTLTATGPTTISGVSGAGTVTNVFVNAGNYTLSETNVAGYTAGLWSCPGVTVTAGAMTLSLGQNITCTINNDDIAPRVTLVKTVTNDNGGTATPGDFTLTATGPTTISGVSGAVTVTNVAVNAGNYTLSETNISGYTPSSWSCPGGTLSVATLTLALGQNITCTINNNDIAPRLTLVKTVINDSGGTATTANFTLTANGPTTITGVSGAPAVSNAAVTAGTYTLSETNVAGYTASAWSCPSATLSGNTLTLTVGQNITCTINNDDNPATLTLIKTVTDTSGGPSTVPLFTLTATNTATSVAISGITNAPAVTNALVNAGTYALSENNLAGYTAGAWSCAGGSLAASNLTLALGQTATCTINNIKLPTLVIRKISNGGTGSFGFSGGNGVTTENIVTTTASATFTGSTSILSQAGFSTSITETMPAAFWQIQTTACTGMGAGGTATLAGNILTLDVAATAAGRNIICTFTNRRRPTVSVQKITTGAFGGAFSFADTNLTGTVTNISTTATNTATPAAPTRLIATTTGTAVSLTETSPLTFVTAGVTCNDANSAVSGNINPVANSSTGAVTIPLGAIRVGADINCVFTNAQAAPQLTVTKTASLPTVSAAGTAVTYTIAVNNSGNTTLNSISVTDALGTVVCPSSGAATVTTLAAGATENCSFVYTVPQSVFNNNGGGDGDIDNTATASTTYNAAPLSANDSETVGLVITPNLTVEKIPNTTAPVSAGNIIGYTYRVTNTGNVTVNNVTINDAHVGYGSVPVPSNEVLVSAPGNSTDAAANGSWDALAPGDIIEFTSSYTVVQADIDNLQ